MAGHGGPIGNRNAAKENRPWRAAIDRAIAQGNGKKLRAIADKLIDLAAEGDMAAIRELGDRLDGKASQSVILDGKLSVTERAADMTDDQLAQIAKNARSPDQP